MKYFVGRGEDRILDATTRRGLRGSYLELTHGVTHYELTGPSDGEVVVLTGGLTVPLSYWDGVVGPLHQRGLRTLTFSAYGRGYSERFTGDYTEDVFAGQVVDLTDALDIGRHHLVGTSMGALVAMASLVERANALTLTLVGPAGLDAPPARQRLFTFNRLARFVGRRFGRRLLEDHLGHNVRDEAGAAALTSMARDAFSYRGSMYALFSTLQNFPLHGRAELFRRTGELNIPTLLVWGDDDQITPISNLDTARALLRPHRCHVIAECGHMAPLERPREVADLIASFVADPADRTTP